MDISTSSAEIWQFFGAGILLLLLFVGLWLWDLYHKAQERDRAVQGFMPPVGSKNQPLSMPRPPAMPRAPMPVIVGSPRSGTTLLRFILDAHPDLAIPPETGFLAIGQQLVQDGADREAFFNRVISYPDEAPAWADFGLDAQEFLTRLRELDPYSVPDGFRLFYRMYAARFGKPRWGDKTPLYGQHLQSIRSLLPETRFIHLIRDGRDASLSLRRCWFSPNDDMRVLADYWRQNILATREQAHGVPHYLEVRYEDLVRDTENVIRRVCGFIDLPFDAAMLRYPERAKQRLGEHQARLARDGSELVSKETRLAQQIETTRPPDPLRIGQWRTAMSPQEVEVFESVAGGLLRSLGYALSGEERGQG